jgi:predicted small secreted protein
MWKRIILIVAVLALSFSLLGCETTKGVGKDIQKIGEAGEKDTK